MVTAFLIAAWIGSAMPRNGDWRQADTGVDIMIETKGVHTAIVMPLITRQMARQAFKIMSHYDYTFSLNITEFDLNAQYLQHFLVALCQQYQIAPQRVILEVLEGISSAGKNSHLKQLKALKQAGFRLAIDDFGTEHSNFERILDLEVDYLKIDAKYIKNIHTDAKSYEIVRALSFFCHNSGIKCIAEFVHSIEVQQCLLALGMDYSQGFLFSRPESFGEHQEQGDVRVSRRSFRGKYPAPEGGARSGSALRI